MTKTERLASRCTDGMWYKIAITPFGKPRMTQSDKWKNRKCVQVYYAFKDYLKLYMRHVNLKDASIVSFIAYIPFPKSYNKQKREGLIGQPHTLKPDIDNIYKAILDSLFDNDQHIYAGLCAKFWEDKDGPRLEILVK